MTKMELGDYIINVNNICKTFPNGVKALCNFTTNIRRAEVVVVIGPSGSGKSTFLRCLNGLEEIDSGEIIFNGIPLDHHKENRLKIRREMGMVFQSFNLFPHMTVLENVMLAQQLVRKSSKTVAKSVSMELLEKVGIQDKIDSYPGQLSGGQQQRVAIARAFANDPSIILADEPTGNLDTKTGLDVIDLLRELNREGNVTIITATHDLKMLDVSDRIVHIEDGRVAQIVNREDADLDVGTLDGQEVG